MAHNLAGSPEDGLAPALQALRDMAAVAAGPTAALVKVGEGGDGADDLVYDYYFPSTISHVCIIYSPTLPPSHVDVNSASAAGHPRSGPAAEQQPRGR